jgi:hypothetical protein
MAGQMLVLGYIYGWIPTPVTQWPLPVCAQFDHLLASITPWIRTYTLLVFLYLKYCPVKLAKRVKREI